jgi:molybdopterin synthase sulfur carrier subunit
MTITLRIPISLNNLLNGREEAFCRGNTVEECLNDIEKKYPGFYANLTSSNKEITNVLIFLNGENIINMEGRETKVKEGDEISIIPFAAGG